MTIRVRSLSAVLVSPLVLMVSVVLVACGDNTTGATATMPIVVATAAPTSTTSSTSTTISPTSTTAAPELLPVPDPVPSNARAAEPRLELGTIEIPKLELSATMYEGVTLTTLDNGPGHWPGTAMPGRLGNVVVAGHRTSHARPFRHLEQLVAGDEVIFTTGDGRFTYTVVNLEIVDPDAIRIIEQTRARTATLFACHPVGSTRQRIVVHLELAP